MSSSDSSADTSPLRFEEALAELELILRDLEDGTTSLEESLARYERGIAILRQCHGQLQSAEQRIRILTGLGEDGTPDLRPFEHVASIEVTRVTARKTSRPREASFED